MATENCVIARNFRNETLFLTWVTENAREFKWSRDRSNALRLPSDRALTIARKAGAWDPTVPTPYVMDPTGHVIAVGREFASKAEERRYIINMEKQTVTEIREDAADYKGGAPCGLKLSAWIAARLDSHGISDADKIMSAFTVDFGVAPEGWPIYTRAQMARILANRGKGGELRGDDGARYIPDYMIAEHYAKTLANFSPWQSGLGFRFHSALEALEKAGY